MEKTHHVAFSQDNNVVSPFTFGQDLYHKEENWIFFALEDTPSSLTLRDLFLNSSVAYCSPAARVLFYIVNTQQLVQKAVAYGY